MSSYTCENFQLSMLYNFQFDHTCLKWLLTVLKSIFEIFSTIEVFFDRIFCTCRIFYDVEFFLSRTNDIVTVLRFVFKQIQQILMVIETFMTTPKNLNFGQNMVNSIFDRIFWCYSHKEFITYVFCSIYFVRKQL